MKLKVKFRDRSPGKVQAVDNIAIPTASTRERTPEGYLKAVAAITKVGVQMYSAREFGVDSDEMIGVFRPPETVFHEETIASARLKPITFIHPEEDVDSKNSSRLAVGVVGENVEPISETILGATIQITEDSIVQKVLDKEVEELSLGYDSFIVSEQGEYEGQNYLYRFDGPMIINHLAIVPEGRCGDSVKILDKGEKTVNWKKFKKALRDAGVSEERIKVIVGDAKDSDTVDMATVAKLLGEAKKVNDIDMGALVPAIVTELMPKLEELVATPEFTSALAKEIAAGMAGGGAPDTDGTDAEDQELDPEKEKEMMDSKIKDAAASKARLIVMASPFITDEKFDVHAEDEEAILKAALKSVGFTDEKLKDSSVEYMSGILDTISEDRVDAQSFSSGMSVNDSAEAKKLDAPITGINARAL